MIRNKPKNIRFQYKRDEIDKFIEEPAKWREKEPLKWEGMQVLDEEKKVIGKRDPRGGGTMLRVVAKEDIPDVLEILYNNPAVGFVGRDKLTAKCYDRFIGISKYDVADYLKSNQVHDIHSFVRTKKINKPVIVSRPNRYYQADLTDWEAYSVHNGGHEYLLTMIDIHSKFVYAEPVRNKTAYEVKEALVRIIDRMPQPPSIVQSDRGGEFKGEFTEYLNTHHIKQIFSKSHTPQSQGTVERVQLTIKRMLKRYMVKNNTRRWVAVLPRIIANYNSTKHDATGMTPAEVAGEDQEYADAHPLDSKIHETTRRIVRHAQDRVNEQRRVFPPLRVGDFVRISVLETDAAERKLEKTHTRKPGGAINWTTDIYRVVKIVKPTSMHELDLPDKYKLHTTTEPEVDLPGFYFRERLLKTNGPDKERNKGEEPGADIVALDHEHNEEPSSSSSSSDDDDDPPPPRVRERRRADREEHRLAREAHLERARDEPIAHRLHRERRAPDRLRF